jgi:lysophospholipase L1-like esterase
MNWSRIGLAVLVVLGATVAFLSWPKREVCPDACRIGRQLILLNTLSRVDDPIIVLGDSIVEASTLPRSLCGHAIVNAGLGGASTVSDLGGWLSGALASKRAGLIVVSLGTNDALGSQSRQAFETRYGALLARLSMLTSHMVVMAVPRLEARGQVTIGTRDRAMDLINGYNAVLPGLAKNGGATFVALPPMPDPHTIDGVHLDAAGYAVWDAAVLQGAASICN